ncbi:MAG: hypothetical protein HQ559_07790 [Lentisphaerae bacterium]|nr:hypothetical protein [Lentisphaerota bacterium]
MIPCLYTLAAGGGDGLFFFILVVITIVVQIIRLSRKSRPLKGEEPRDSVFGRGDEIGSFLENLSRGTVPPAETPAPPSAPPPVPVPTVAVADPGAEEHGEVRQTRECRQGTGGKIVKLLRHSQGIRQAVLLREILGPPTGLAGPPSRSRS